MYSSSDIYLDGCNAEHLSPNHPEPPSLNLGGLVGFYSSHKNSKNINGPIHRTENAASGLSWSSSKEYNLAAGHNWSLNSGHQAKRARVENIIKGITCTDIMLNQQETSCLEEKGVEVSALHHKQMDACGNESNENLREFKTKFNPSCKDEGFPRWSISSDFSTEELVAKSCSKSENSPGKNHQEWEKLKLGHLTSKPDWLKLMADILKYELTQAVSRSVDSIFKSMLLTHTTPETTETETALPPQSAACMDNNLGCRTAEVQLSDDQTEALALVVQKPELEQPQNVILKSTSAAPLIPKSPISLSCEPETLEQNNSTDHQPHIFTCLQDGCCKGGEPRLNKYWNLVKVKSKFPSRSVRSPHPHVAPLDLVILDSLHRPQVKSDPESLEKTNLYMLNECLTTNHLKKAKLMFFYTRYPSSVVLKMCFHDVQFTRCITSQLIKWFSNFREFYYIQMEKFARNALLEGLVTVRDLAVSRESELLRTLNMHYNKANDFQVPDRFLEVAEITLREFYIAISMGKDRDPSWKKMIYKVICKLDSDVPPEFKSNHLG